jgi:hypothetical protein
MNKHFSFTLSVFLPLLIAFCFYSPLARTQIFAQEKKPDVWQPMKYFVGTWHGNGTGESGNSTVKRTYHFVLNDKFIHGENTSTYAPQEKNPKGEIHHHWDVFSYDKSRKKFILRQFHQEGFVNEYVLDSISADGTYLSFITESIENIPSGWRAKETYHIVNVNEFTETFELAEPGKEFAIYSENRFKRKSEQ